MKKVIILLFIASIIFSSCSKNQDDVTLASNSATQLAVQEKSAVAASTFPGYSFCLAVPWLPQVPPGDWANTKNCGQTCAVMLSGYFNKTAVNSSQITAENTWLYGYTGNSAYNNANGYYTSTTQIQALLLQKHGLTSSILTGATVDDILNQAYSGKPCIAHVRISGGTLVGSGGVDHWTLVVGFDGYNVITNDPGSSSGYNRAYSKAAFTASWTLGSKLYMPVSK